jgi:hypothetical protein
VGVRKGAHLTTGVVELYQPDEETLQEIVVLTDSSMLTRSLPADTVKPCIKSVCP